ncbi:MAG: ferrochelatase [Nevskiaceae bacterium]|nr:MAG: ferrochelatase [Nevskiaceae bacterium]TBR71363.1 MAG: ferrochelatase [Nevskiaceae bacterium]
MPNTRNPYSGVLLVNLGTPSAPTAAAIRRYLREFLSDPRVIEVPRAVWLPILHGAILPRRPRRLVPAYEKIWTPEGSPLRVIGERQAHGVAERLQKTLGKPVEVRLAMAYGEPSLPATLAEFHSQGVERLVVLPLFPQYSGATIGAVHDAVGTLLRGQRVRPELCLIHDYHKDSGYIAALAASVQAHWARHGRGRHLLLSFHGVPQSYVDAGDPYRSQCETTARLLAEALRLKTTDWSLAFQSRFGKAPWLKPYTDERIAELAHAGTPLDVFCPGFAADCLETLEEVAIRYRALYAQNGGSAFHVVPALNDSPEHLDALAAIAARRLAVEPV